MITKTFRLFISSTFSDFIAEREALQKEVFPKLEVYCAERGARFQAVDLRWGITEEAQREHATMRICLEEIRRCQQLSPRPNFAVLLGDRYGWEPVPARIPEAHWRRLLPTASEADAELIQQSYRLDENAIPPVYCLRERAKDEEALSREARLLQALRRCARSFRGRTRLPYFASATHQEIVLGALFSRDEKHTVLNPDQHVHVYVRRLEGMPHDESAKDFIDWDTNSGQVVPNARDRLRRLECQLRRQLGDRVHDLQTTWKAYGSNESVDKTMSFLKPGQATMQNRSARIFLSSTFRDFHDERRLLVQEVFLTLRERLRSRFVALVDVDLRWGIPAEEAESGRVLGICLDEVDQCRPYFIGLLGERYGWVPTVDKYPSYILESHPWLSEHHGLASATELEIRYGVLNNPAMRQRALFFFRDPAYAQSRGGEFLLQSDEDADRQTSLKQQIKESGLPVLHYQTPEQLARMLEAELWKLLDAEFPASDVPDAQELETLRHRSYAAFKVGPKFVQDPLLSLLLPEALAQGYQRILITGAGGSGKSTLIADWLRCAEEDQHGENILYHFVEADDESATAADLIGRIIEIIRRRSGSLDPVPKDRSTLMTSLPIWLATAHAFAERTNSRWIIILDGLDGLRTGRDLLWLPTFLPSTVQLVVSSRPGTIRGALKRRGAWKDIQIKPLSRERQQAMLAGQLAVFKKRLGEEQIAVALTHPCADQALFLSVLAEELRVFGSFEGLQDHLNDLVSTSGIDDLYERIFQRLEIHHRDGIRLALSGICLSRGGLTEEEVLGFSGLAVQARWAPIRLALGDALSNASGRVRPSHAHLRKAVKDRYYPDEQAERALRLELASWFGQRSDSARRASEQTHQLWNAAAYSALLGQLSDLAVFKMVDRLGGSSKLHQYWADIETNLEVSAKDHYQSLWSQWRAGLTLEKRIDLSERLQRFFRFRGSAGEFPAQLAHQSLRDCQDLYGPSDPLYLKHLGGCANTLAMYKSELDNARRLAEEACSGIERVAGSEAPELPSELLNLALICLKQRDIQPGIVAVRRGLLLQEALTGQDHPSLVAYLNCLTDLLLKGAGRARPGGDGRLKGRIELLEGIQIQTRCLRILGRTLGLEHLDSAASLVRIGHVFARCLKVDHATRAYKRAQETRVRLLGKRHPLTRSAGRLLERYSGTGDVNPASDSL